MRTNVYIDGFNLYYRAVKGTPYKWLDLLKLSQALVPRHEINRIRYFTALVTPRPDNPHVHIRQQTYIRALHTIPDLTVHYGTFRRRVKTRPLAASAEGQPQYVTISDTEEKGSDVNLATYLLVDGYENDYEQALVISNDSDLAFPIKVVREKLGKAVGVVNPNRERHKGIPAELKEAATFLRQIYESTLRRCQLPDVLSDARGTIHKPQRW